ncbi:PleD family two-component response regulator [Desulfobaculum xiamenense]|uniref:PleD family two-component response regulator n=1 Tax=Desulfobaculum xiamenense TaxID=995050 RepID=A0A846QJL3_9BACT|nr:response regulator [Desulfobaculum xiamenense]NJB69066.1 PleD family two-component response regulator [Desulfobaculum xiamenense]
MVQDTEVSPAMRVLVIEDSNVQAKIISRHIEGVTNFSTVWAGTLEEAKSIIAEMREELFVAVVDLNLPDAPDGEAVDLTMSYGLPSIVLTATFHDEVRDSLLERNVADYVLKESIVVLDSVVDSLSRLFKNQFLKALVVDDSRAARNLVRNLLEIQNFQVLEAGDGQEALEVVAATPDLRLVVTDWEMPRMDGFTLCGELRKAHKKDSLAIVGISGAGGSAMTAKFLKLGANDFLAKPFSAEEFSWRVNQTMEMVELVKELNECQELRRK